MEVLYLYVFFLFLEDKLIEKRILVLFIFEKDGVNSALFIIYQVFHVELKINTKSICIVQ